MEFIKSILGDRKKLSIAAIVVIAGAIVLTVFVAQQQQEIRQRAAEEQTAFFFSTGSGCLNPVTSTTFPASQTSTLNLCLNTNNTGVNLPSGFDVTIAKGNGITFTGISDGVDSLRLNNSYFNTITSDGSIRYGRVDSQGSTISGTALNIGTITLTAASTGTGTISMIHAQVVTPTSTSELTVAKPTLSYTITSTTCPATGNVVFDNASTGVLNTANGILRWNHELKTTNDNRLLLVGINNMGGNPQQVKYADQRLTAIQDGTPGKLYYLLNPPTGVHEVVVDFYNEQTIGAGATSWYNVNQSTPFGTGVVNQGTSASPSVSGVGADCGVVVDSLATTTTCTTTPVSPQIQRYSVPVGPAQGSAVDHTGIAAGSSKTSSPNFTMSWNMTNNCNVSWTLKAISLVAVGSNPPPAPTATPTPTSSPTIPDCNSGQTCDPLCTPNQNSCDGSGTKTCRLTLLSTGGNCNQVTQPGQICGGAIPNCSSGFTCSSNGVCIAPTSAPTSTPTPTGTGGGGNITLALTVGLDAIGNTGDNATPNDFSASNKNPNRKTRNVTVEVFNNTGTSVANKSGTLAYQTGSGKFTGNVDMGTFASGNYNIKIKSDGYLRRLVPGIQNVTSGQTYNVPAVNLVTGDINSDNAINILDYNILISCSIFSADNQGLCSSNSQYKTLSDLDDNGVINQFDYNFFLRELSVQNGD